MTPPPSSLGLLGIALLVFFNSWSPAGFGAESYSFMRSGKDLLPLKARNPGWSVYAGNPGEKDWKSSPGLITSFSYSGTGPLPAPKEFIVPLDPPLGTGTHRVFVRNFYRGRDMEATLGHERKSIPNVRYEWSPGVVFEVDPAQTKADALVLKFFSTAVENSGEKQDNLYILQGIFITTDFRKSPQRDGEIVDLIPDAEPPSIKGNILQNGSFEAGLGHGWGKTTGTSWLFGTGHLDATTAAHGRTSARIELQVNRRGGKVVVPFESRFYRLPPNRDFVLSFQARADRPLQLGAGLQAMDGQLKNYASGGLQESVQVTGEWQRFEIAGRTRPVPGHLYSVVFSSNQDAGETVSPGNLWLDAIQLEEGIKATPYRGANEIEVGHAVAVPGAIYHEGDPAELELRLFNHGQKRTATLRHRVTDYWGHEVDHGEKKLTLDPGNHAERLPLFHARRGIFHAEFSIEGGGPPAELVYSVLPPNAAGNQPNPAGTLGTDAPCENEGILRILKRARFDWLLTKSYGRWYVAEPEKGKFHFFDREMENARHAGFSVVIQTLNPDWGTQEWLKPFHPAPGTHTWEPAKWEQYLAHWEDFHAKMAAHYKPWVRHWEIENEPNAGFAAGLYPALLERAARAIRREDPQAKVVGFSSGGFSEQFYAEGIRSGTLGSCDIVSVHLYTGALDAFRKFGEFLAKHQRPGWNTETGLTAPSFYRHPCFEEFRQKDYSQVQERDLKAAVNSTVANYLLTVSVGRMERYFHYFARFGNASPSQPTRWVGGGKEIGEYDGSLRANGVGLSIAAYFLNGATWVGEIPLREDICAFVMEREGKGIALLWLDARSQGVKAHLELPPRAERKLVFHDVMGNPFDAAGRIDVTASPVYGLSTASGAELLAILKETRLR